MLKHRLNVDIIALADSPGRRRRSISVIKSVFPVANLRFHGCRSWAAADTVACLLNIEDSLWTALSAVPHMAPGIARSGHRGHRACQQIRLDTHQSSYRRPSGVHYICHVGSWQNVKYWGTLGVLHNLPRNDSAASPPPYIKLFCKVTYTWCQVRRNDTIA